MATKVALLYSFQPSSWASCRAIVANILEVYRRGGDAHDVPRF